MPNPSKKLQDLAKAYQSKTIEFPNLKAVTLASWILESGWGASDLSVKHNNFAGMKFRKAVPNAISVEYPAHDGVDFYCKFGSLAHFIEGYWAFLDRAPYQGWRAKAGDAEDFIEFVGPIWAQDAVYSEKVLNLLPAAQKLLNASPSIASAAVTPDVCDACGHEDHDEPAKPRVNRWEATSHKAGRNNTDIDHIVIHYTTSRNIEGTISHFKHGEKQTSAHYIIGRDGVLVQMVNDNEVAWHAGSKAMNARSIGIEHVAAPGDRITSDQAATSAALITWLMQQYDVPKANVIPHVCIKSTSCCGDLFADFGGKAGGSCDVQKAGLHKWMTSVGI